jgi:hypothetical protein
MIPAVSQSFGTQMFYIRGGSLTPFNLTFLSDLSFGRAVGQSEADRGGGATSDAHTYFFGGINTYWGGAYANHKPVAFYNAKLYQASNRAKDSDGWLYLTRFDGSGIFFHQGSDYQTDKWKGGRGSELITPSGVTSLLSSSDMGMLVYNGNLFIAGAITNASISPGSNKWVTDFGWDLRADTFTINATKRKNRLYQMFVVDSNDKKIGSVRSQFLPHASQVEYTNTCDMIGHRDSVYYANWIDVLKFPGGSGAPIIIQQDLSNPSSKSFALWPASGYLNSVPSGQDSVFMLTGSGVLKRILSPSGTETVVDFANIRTDSFRTSDNLTARINSSTIEPGRSCLLLPYNNKLNAFVISATSGYMHFICNGDPRTSSNWTDRSDFLPEELRRFDGNLFGFVDDFRNRLYTLHCSMSEVGLWGHVGVSKTAGGIKVSELNLDNSWTNIYRGVAGLPVRGFIPYMNEGPSILTPSGNNPEILKCSDYAILTYKLFDAFNRNTNVDIQYSLNRGLTWNDARRFRSYDTGQLLGSGLIGLPASPFGEEYLFYWDYVNDIGFNNVQEVIIRISPRLSR